jgi:hypothetical protein
MSLNHLTTPIEGGNFYHIFSHGFNQGDIFFAPNNYSFFIRRFQAYLSPFIDTLAYSLMPSHFHILIRANELIMVKNEVVDHPVEVGHFISEAFRKFFIAYSQAIIKQENLTGNLIDNNFSRVKVDEEKLKELILYIHYNPQQHGVCQNFRNYDFSSYTTLNSGSKSFIDRDTVYHLFGDSAQFSMDHDAIPDFSNIKDLLLDI